MQSDRFPFHKIAWRVLWILPLLAARILFVATVAVFSFGEDAKKAWEVTA